MASTYSTNLKIELQATGENPGTWGTITNTNLGTTLEQAIVGYGNPSYASDANLTLTYTDTNAAQTARSLVLNVTSAVSLTATRELVVPTIHKQYIVQNNTTGAQSITVKTSAGTGITVPNGRKAHLYVDGTNVIQMFDFVDINGGTIDGATIGGSSAGAGTFTTLTATTLGGALNANSQAITNANIDSGTIDGATIGGSSAGAGTFTTLTTSSTVTLNGGTANGLLYLNGSKVATSGSAVTFNGTNLATTGTASATKLIPTGGTATGNGMYLPATNTLALSTNGVERVRVDSSGNLGIGTSSPTNALSVTGNANITGNTTLGDASTDTVTVNGYMGVGGAASSARGLLVTGSTMTGSTQIGLDSSITGSATGTSLIAAVNGTPTTAAAAFTVTDLIGLRAGEVAKGAGSTITNKHGLYIADQTQGTNNYGITSLVSSGANKWNIYASGTAANYFAGDVLVGTTSSGWSGSNTVRVGQLANVFSISAAGSSGLTYNLAYDGTNWLYQNSLAGTVIDSSNTFAFRIRTAPSGTAGDVATLTERLRLDFSGNLGLGVTPVAYTTNARTFHIDGGANSTQIRLTNNTTGTAQTNGGLLSMDGNQLSVWNVENDALRFGTNDAERMRLDSTGRLGIGTSSPVGDLHVTRTDAAELVLQATNAGGRQWLIQTGDTSSGVGGALRFYDNTASSERMRLDSSGNLIVGSSASNIVLTAAGAASIKNTANTSGFDIGLLGGSSDPNAYIYQRANGYLAFGTNNTERVRIDSSGSLRIGTTSTSGPVLNGGLTTSSVQTELFIGRSGAVESSGEGRGASIQLQNITNNTACIIQQYSNNLQFFNYTGGGWTERVRIDSSGNLGIGTSSPDTKLTVTVADTAVSTRFKAVTGVVRFRPYVDTTLGAIIDSSNAAESAYLPFTLIGSTLRLFGGGGTGATIDSSGNLGLGVTPSAWSGNYKGLQVAEQVLSGVTGQSIQAFNAYFNSGWKYINSTSANYIEVTGGEFRWYTAPSGTAGNAISFTQAMTLDASGNFLVGTTASRTGIRGVFRKDEANSTGGAIVLENRALNPGRAGSLLFAAGRDVSDPSYVAGIWAIADYNGVGNSANLVFGTTVNGTSDPLANIERARITSSGDLLVGTTTDTGNKLAVYASAGTAIAGVVTDNASQLPLACWSKLTSGDNLFASFGTEASYTPRGTIDYNRAGGLVRYNTTSDYRAKDIIGPVQNPGATIDALKVYEGKMKGATQSRPMLVAHEAQEHAPYAVSGVKDELNEDGTPKFQQMDVSSLVPLLLAEIQSLRARVAALESN